MNSITIKGKIWEPTIKTAHNGTLILDTSVSIYTGKDRDGKAKYMNMAVKAFKDVAADAADSLNKGDNVVVIGNMSQDTWDDKTTGKKQYKTVLIAETIAKDTRRVRGAASEPASQFGHDVAPDDEILF